MKKIIKKIFNSSTKVWHFSDSHGGHELINVPEDIDIAIFSGDGSNNRLAKYNLPEYIQFLEWYAAQPIQHKIIIGGNHDTALEERLISKEEIESYGLTYLENDSVTIKGVKIWGSPFTPVYGDWAFQMPRHKLDAVWQHIPDDTDIIVVHGPPKGVLDLSYNFDKTLDRCGCSALMKRIQTIEPKIVMFGHIHNNKDILNSGYVKYMGMDTIFSNGTVASNRNQIISSGNVFEL